MSSWAERVHKRAADLGSVVTSCGHPGSSTPSYPYRLEKVKFGVPLEEVCKNDNIPGPLLVLILKLNKESPNRRDVFRAPGHQGAMKKLIHFLQAGRLVNVDNYSVYTIASVLKKFLRKIPNGIFGRSGEKELFAIIELDNEAEQTERLHRLFTSLPKYTQHLLVLLFGTFRVIASNAAPAATGMTSEALGVSVAPSFFQSCVSDGKTARMEDVLKFKVATKIMKHIIDKFATCDLFGRENYEYYARVTGRILKVQDEWICSFQYPPPPRGKLAQQKYALQHSLEAEKTWLQCQCERWGLLAQEESRSTPALLTSSSSAVDNSVLSLGVTPEHTFIESCARLSVSLEGPGIFAMTSSPLPKRNSIRGDELLLMQHRRIQRDVDEDDFITGELDYDEDNYGDDDDDGVGGDGDGGGGVDYDDFEKDVALDDSHADELGLCSSSSSSHVERQQRQLKMTPKPKPTLSSKKKQIRKAALAVGSTAAAVGVGIGLNEGERVVAYDGHNYGYGDDDDDAMLTANKRRYRQNKKTTTQTRNLQQHARRLRVGSKSLDGTATAIEARAQSQGSTLMPTQTQRNVDSIAAMKSKSQAKTKLTKTQKSVGSAATAAVTAAAATASTSALTTATSMASPSGIASSGAPRTCSRCNRGIRHSSSCSSTSGGAGGTGAGAGGNGGKGGKGGNVGNSSGMTMEELRAVNRYAESTKSLSYLPQLATSV